MGPDSMGAVRVAVNLIGGRPLRPVCRGWDASPGDARRGNDDGGLDAAWSPGEGSVVVSDVVPTGAADGFAGAAGWPGVAESFAGASLAELGDSATASCHRREVR